MNDHASAAARDELSLAASAGDAGDAGDAGEREGLEWPMLTAAHPLYEPVVAALKTVYDPEIPVDIYELGLIYDIRVSEKYDLSVDMTLTAPGCPVAEEMPGMVAGALATVPGVGALDVDLVWDPPWDISRMSDEARLELGMF